VGPNEVDTASVTILEQIVPSDVVVETFSDDSAA